MNRLRLLLLLWANSGTASALAADLDGFWKIDNQPVWMEIQTDGASPGGTVRRNDNNPDAVGFTLLKGLSAVNGDSRAWVGQIFAARLGEYRDAEIQPCQAGASGDHRDSRLHKSNHRLDPGRRHPAEALKQEPT